MANDPVLSLLGLARRAGKLAQGDEQARALCAGGKARCVFLASDAGDSTVRRARQYAGRAGIPCIRLPSGREALGAATGKASGCAVCAVSDIGLAEAAVRRLAEAHPGFEAAAVQLAKKNARIQSRRGKRKQKTAGPQRAAGGAGKIQRNEIGGSANGN